jgi:glycosyltransferase involved in cell wall biosynthesis
VTHPSTTPLTAAPSAAPPTGSAEDGGSNPLVSVIIPTFNRAHLLPRAIESIRRQSYSPIELIIVDDGSTDGTQEIIGTLEIPGLIYLRQARNEGASAARNAGIDRATGEYVAFLDSDDEWLPNRLSAAIERFRWSELRPLGVVSCGHRALRANGRTTEWIPKRRGWLLPDLMLQRNLGIGNPFLVIDAALLRRYQIRFDTSMQSREEWDLAVQLAKHAQFDFVPEPLVVVHHHDGARLWNPERALQAGEHLHQKYGEEIERNPRYHSRFHLRNALTCLAARDRPRAIGEVRAAVAASPGDVLAYFWWLLVMVPRGALPAKVFGGWMWALRRLTFDT